MAELALARPHRHRRVALRELERVESLRDRAVDVLRRHVFADADEALVDVILAGLRAQRARRGAAAARDRPHRLDAVRQCARDEDRARWVVVDASTDLGEERVRGLTARRRDDQVAIDPRLREMDSLDVSLSPARLDPPERSLPEIDDALDGNAGLAEIVDDVEVPVVRADHDGALSGLDGEVAHEAPNGARQHHADEVVSREHDRLLECSRGDHDPLGAVAVEDRAAVDRHEAALPDAERTGRREHLDAVELLASRAGTLVHEHDARSVLRRLDRRRAARASAADDQDARPPVLDVVAARVAGVRVELPEAGRVPQELLVVRPHPARPDHRPVVEADGRERPSELVRQGHQVALERADDVLRAEHRSMAHRLDADPHVRHAVDGHHAVRAVARAAEEPARAVVLERAGEQPPPRRVHGRPERVSGEAADREPVEREDDARRAVDQLIGARRKPHAAPPAGSGREISRISFVRVSRRREEPLAAARPVLPPLALRAGDVVPEIDVVGEFAQRRRAAVPAAGRAWSTRHLAVVRVLLGRSGPAEWAREQEGHQLRNCGLSNTVPNSATTVHGCPAPVNRPPAALAPPNARSPSSTRSPKGASSGRTRSRAAPG